MRTLILAIVLLSSFPALAQPSKVVAEQLFNQGRELAKANKWAEACPKFEASLRQDPTLGTKLNLATCYERIGKLASAWAMYRDAAEAAAKAGDTRRRDHAKQSADALLPRLPKLALQAPASAPEGLVVQRAGAIVDPAELGLEVYVDPGECEVVATAPGHLAFSTKLFLKEGETKTLPLPTLEREQAAPPPPAPDMVKDATTTTATSRLELREGPRTRKALSAGVATVGLLAVGAGLGFGASASRLFDDAKALCGEDLSCSPETYDRDKRMVDRARTYATTSTLLVSAGGVAIAASAFLYFTSPREQRPASARLVPIATGDSAGLAIAGGF
jgi:serine/threonine-protein kinase